MMLNRGQSIIEYVILVGVVTMALIYMSGDFKRGVQGIIKVTADQLGEQKDSDQEFDRRISSGVLVNSDTTTFANRQKSTEYLGEAGTRVQVNEMTQSFTNGLSNQAFEVVPVSVN